VLFRRRKVDKSSMRREVAKLIIDLKQLHRRAYYYRSRLENKILNYMERLKYVENPALRGEILRNVEMYKKALKVVTRIEAILEVMIVKLDTLGLLNVTVKEIALIKEVLSNVKSMSEGIPDISLIIEDIIERAGDLLTYIPETRTYTIHVSEEASQVIADAGRVAEERLRALNTSA